MKNNLKWIAPLLAIIFLIVIFDYSSKTLRWNMYDNFWGSLFAGLIVVGIVFLIKKDFSIINLSGEWSVIEYIDETTYAQYKNYKLYYIFHLLQKDDQITGYGEKVKQDETDNVITVFETAKRVRVEFEGSIEKKYFGKTKIHFLIYEYGRRRETSTSYTLESNSKNKLTGYFKSTAANASGRVELVKQ